jgi:hypothetical protein
VAQNEPKIFNPDDDLGGGHTWINHWADRFLAQHPGLWAPTGG